jgi:hypothetical protein
MLLRRLAVPAGRLPAVALCALAAHALVYRTLWPSDGVHAYFGWYEPLVAAVSLAALAGLLGFVAVALVARRCGRPLRPRGWTTSADTLPATARSLGSASLVLLLLQESVERSVEAGRPAFQAFSPSQWLVLLACLAALSLLLALGLRAARAVVRRALEAPPRRRADDRWLATGRRLAADGRRRLRPLAERFALRAPPLASS